MNETVPTSARALGRIRHPALGPKRHPTVQKSAKRTEQSATEGVKGDTWTLNIESVTDSRTSKQRLNKTEVASNPFPKSSPSANSVSTKHRVGQLRWNHGNNHSASYAKPSINPELNIVTGMQFHAITRGRDPYEDVASETQKFSNENGSRKSNGKIWVADQGPVRRGRAFVKLSRNLDSQWQAKRNYLEDGDYVKGKGHRIDTGPLSRPVSGWLNRESRNAVELAEQDNGEGGLGRYYSLDVNTGAVTARQLANGECIQLGVNGKERKQMNGGRCEEEDGEEEELTSDAEDDEMVNAAEPEEESPSPIVPLCWDDQFTKPKIKVVEPRLPSAQPSSENINETKPVIFSSRGLQQQPPPTFIKMLRTPTKENYVSMALQKRTSQPVRNKPQNVKFHEFPLRSARTTIDSTLSDGEENLESFRHRSPLQSVGMWSMSFFPASGNEAPGRTDVLVRSNGRHGEALIDMIVVGNAQISSKTFENEKPVSRVLGGGAASEKHVPIHHQRGSGGGREPGTATLREVSIINIVQPIRAKGDSDDTKTESGKTSERKNDSAVRLRYSNLRASTAVRRGHPEGIHKKGIVRSASVGEGRLAAVARENSGYDWNLNCISIKSALHGEAPKDQEQMNKTGEWVREDTRLNGSQPGGGKEREAIGKKDLSQPFDVVQLSPIRVKTAAVQARNLHLLDIPYTEANNALGSSSEISLAPPPSRAATPNVKSSSAKNISVHEGKTPSGGDSEETPLCRDEGEIPSSRDKVEIPSTRDSRKGVVILHVVPSATKSQVSSECEDLPRSPEVEEEKSLRRENSYGEDTERSFEVFEQRMASEVEFRAKLDEMELDGRVEDEQIERQSPIV